MKKRLFVSILESVLLWAMLALFLFFGLFETWQLKLSDTLFTNKKPNSDVVIIGIDDKSIIEIGRWPWDRKIHAEFLDKIERGKPKAVGVDISFLEPQDKSNDGALAEAIKNAGNVTLASELVDNNVLSPIFEFRDNAKAGIVNTIADSDGVTRKAVLEDSFAVKILNLNENDLANIPREKKLLRINFVGKPETFKEYSFIDVLDGKVDENIFKDKIVLVGVTAPDLHDNQITPTSSGTPMAGVEIQANIIQTLENQDFLVPESKIRTLLLMLVLGLVLSILLAFLRIGPGIILVIVAVFIYILYAIFSFDAGIIRNLVYPPLLITFTGVGNIILKYFLEYRQRRYIRKAFSYYLSESVMKEVLENPKKLKLGGERKIISVLFSDIAGFTSISETLKPETLSRLLNQYLTRMTNIVFENKGVLDKYIGDAVMAFWGAPIEEKDHAYLACKSALEMQEALGEIKKVWQKKGASDLSIRIGVNSGEMAVGNMGSESRFDYTLIGDNVNLGSRLEGINKLYGTKIIISQATRALVKDRVVSRKLDVVAVKGKAKGIVIYELRSLGKPSRKEQEFLKDFEEARYAYEKGKFKEAKKLFLILHKRYPDDAPIKMYIERCEEFSKNKPEEWDGVYRAMVK